MNPNQPLRIGQIDYANVWPLFHNFPHELFHHELEFIAQVPTSLNHAMADGVIDMGPISSFAYGDHFSNYLLFPNLSVSSLGSVHSILLFHKLPLDELNGKKIALPNTSATSVNLLKILLGKFMKITPQYDYYLPSLHEMMLQNDAALLIGDDAIRASWTNQSYMVTDLGDLWRKITGKWMSFAVWAIRKQIVQQYPGLVHRVYQAFVLSKRKSLANPGPLVNEAQRTIGGDHLYWQRYFRNLNYDFGPEQRSGLQLYYDYAFEMGLLAHKAPLQLWHDHTTLKVKK